MTSTKQYQISQAENNVAQIGLQNTAAQLAIKNLEQERDDKIKQQQDTIVETKGRLALLLTQGTGVTLSDYSAWAADA